MRVIRCATPQEFLERAEPFLRADEACHNLLLGTPANLIVRGIPPAQAPYFAVVTEPVITEPDTVVAAAMVTPPFPLVLSRIEHPQALELIAQDLHAAAMALPGVNAPVPVGRQFAEIWQAVAGRRYAQTMAQRIYRLEGVRPVTGVSGCLRRATMEDRPVLIPWLRAFNTEAIGEHGPPFDPEEWADRRQQGTTEGVYFWDDAGPRALAGYSGPTPHGIRVGPVYTPPEHRSHGYASACVAGLSRLLLDRGYQFCFLYTDLANPTSNRIYQRIGYEPVCDVVLYRFLPG